MSAGTRDLFTCHFLLASTPSYTVAGLALFVHPGERECVD
jgi:hypothetical protein